MFLLLNMALAVPLQMTQQGRIMDNNGAALAGTHVVTFSIYDDLNAGNKEWEEILVVSFTNGYYAAVLGTDEQNNPLDSSVLESYPLFLELTIDSNNPMSPRHPIQSAPFAQIAGVAESVNGGTVRADSVHINSTQVIDGTGSWVGQPITVDWSQLTGVPQYISDGDDNTQLSESEVETYITNGGIDLDATSSINGETLIGTPQSCTAGQVLVYQGNDLWACTNLNTMFDSDGDGYAAWDDCDDNDATSGSKIGDQDCDGIPTAQDCNDNDASSTTISTDADCDGVLTALDCNDNNASLGAQSNDADCDGYITADDCDDFDSTSNNKINDADCDGYITADDCNDNDSAIYPFAGDIYNDGVDSDCDGFDCSATSDGSTYFAYCNVSYTWQEAQTACQDAGYDGLATILDGGENGFLQTLLADFAGNPWIGFTDTVSEGNWGWVSNYGVSFINWNSGEPNNSGNNEDCGHFLGSGSTSYGYWNDALCSNPYTMICERR